jgi:hypothetical protein
MNKSPMNISLKVWNMRPLKKINGKYDEKAIADYSAVADAVFRNEDVDVILAMPEIKAYPKLIAYIERFRK